jgi:hypothetical protein
MSVWNQQKVYWQLHNIDTDPIVKFTNDLAAEVAVWLASGDQVVLGLDVNEDVRDGMFQWAMEHAGLVGLITKQHGLDGPPTYIDGSLPIDELFVSPALIHFAVATFQCSLIIALCGWISPTVWLLVVTSLPLCAPKCVA